MTQSALFKCDRNSRFLVFDVTFFAPSSTHTCSVQYWAFKGNASTIGKVGGMPGYPIQANSAVVDPNQFGFPNGPAMAASIGDHISGSVTINAPGPFTFNFANVRETIGAGKHGLPSGALPGENVRQALERLHPGSVLLELPGLPRASFAGVGHGTLTLPGSVPCP